MKKAFLLALFLACGPSPEPAPGDAGLDSSAPRPALPPLLPDPDVAPSTTPCERTQKVIWLGRGRDLEVPCREYDRKRDDPYPLP